MIVGLCRNDRFKNTAALRTWSTLKASERVQILPDELNTWVFTDAVTRINGLPARDRTTRHRSVRRPTRHVVARLVARHTADALRPAAMRAAENQKVGGSTPPLATEILQ